MYKLLIVDDEELDREGLKEQIEWEEYNVICVGTAKNGFDAIRKFEELDPDIVISDVKMPGMTGLKLVEELRKVKPSIRVAFVSGYDDFEFARTAIRLEACEYILKPVNSEELINAVTHMVNELKYEDKVREEREMLVQLADEGALLIKERLLKDIIYGTIKNEQLSKIDEFMGESGPINSYTAIRVDVEGYSAYCSEISEEEKFDKLMSVERILKSESIGYFKMELISIEPAKFILLLFSSEELSTQFAEIIRVGCLRLVEKIKNSLDVIVTLAVGNSVNSAEEVYKSYNSCCELMSSKLLIGTGTVITKLPAKQKENIQSKLFYNIAEEISKSVRNSDFDRLRYLYDYLFYNIESVELYSSVHVQDIFINIISRLKLTLYEMNITEADVFGEEAVLWDKLVAFESMSDIKNWLMEIFDTVISYLQQDSGKGNKKVLDKVKKYVEDNYSKDISLKELAHQLYYSPNHLGFIVKEYTGKGFNEFLIEYRMKKAAELLKNPALRIYEVAEAVSYRNLTAFNNKFRDIFGVSPKEYRERLLP